MSVRFRANCQWPRIANPATLVNVQHKASMPDMPLVLMTDDRRCDWVRAARALPRGSVVVVRGRDAVQRRMLAEELQGLASLLIADDPALAAEIGAAGLHLPERRMREAWHWRARFPHWIITSSAHSLRALMGASMLDAVFLSPVFATASHKQATPPDAGTRRLYRRPGAGAGLCAGRRHVPQCRAAGAGIQRHCRYWIIDLTS